MTVQSILQRLKSVGISKYRPSTALSFSFLSRKDPRISNLAKRDPLTKLSVESFRTIDRFVPIVKKALTGKLVIPGWNGFKEIVEVASPPLHAFSSLQFTRRMSVLVSTPPLMKVRMRNTFELFVRPIPMWYFHYHPWIHPFSPSPHSPRSSVLHLTPRSTRYQSRQLMAKPIIMVTKTRPSPSNPSLTSFLTLLPVRFLPFLFSSHHSVRARRRQNS